MADLIDRQTALREIHKQVWLADTAKIALEEKLSALPSAQQWIPCGERLPWNDDSVLACYYDGEDHACAVAWHDGEKWQCWDDRIGFGFDVVAWMPLPKPYKGGKQWQI